LPRSGWRSGPGELIKNPDTSPGRLPSALARSLYSDSLTYDVESLLLAVHRYGADHVMLGTDYPFTARESPAGAVIGEARPRLSTELRTAVGSANAHGFLAIT